MAVILKGKHHSIIGVKMEEKKTVEMVLFFVCGEKLSHLSRIDSKLDSMTRARLVELFEHERELNIHTHKKTTATSMNQIVIYFFNEKWWFLNQWIDKAEIAIQMYL